MTRDKETKKAAFVSMHIPKEVQTEPWGLTGEWCWKKAYQADVLNPRLVARQWSVLDAYDLIFVPGYISGFQWLRELFNGHRPRGKVITWIDYSSELIWRLPAIVEDPTLPMVIKQADVIISPEQGFEPYYRGTEAQIVAMAHPVDGEVLKQRFHRPSLLAKVSGAPVCLWVFHRWQTDSWPRIVPMVQAYPEYAHIAVGLSPEGREYAEMYLDAAFTILPMKDFLRLLAGSTLCVDMHSYRSIGRVVLEAASLGVPVLVNRTPTCHVDTWKWYNGLNVGCGPVQAEQVKRHWIKQAKADLDAALNGGPNRETGKNGGVCG